MRWWELTLFLLLPIYVFFNYSNDLIDTTAGFFRMCSLQPVDSLRVLECWIWSDIDWNRSILGWDDGNLPWLMKKRQEFCCLFVCCNFNECYYHTVQKVRTHKNHTVNASCTGEDVEGAYAQKSHTKPRVAPQTGEKHTKSYSY